MLYLKWNKLLFRVVYVLHKIDIFLLPTEAKDDNVPPKFIDIYNVLLDMKVKNGLHWKAGIMILRWMLAEIYGEIYIPAFVLKL